jgi:hypothetical protein
MRALNKRICSKNQLFVVFAKTDGRVVADGQRIPFCFFEIQKRLERLKDFVFGAGN